MVIYVYIDFGGTFIMELPTWAITVITLVFSTIITTVVSLVMKWTIQKHLDKKDQEQIRLERYEQDARKKESQKEIAEIVSDSIQPLVKRIDTIDGKITRIQEEREIEREATTTTMRIKMMELRDNYVKRGYCNSHEKATLDELYHRYRNMGGNHFSEYVDAYIEDVHRLPDEPKNN